MERESGVRFPLEDNATDVRSDYERRADVYRGGKPSAPTRFDSHQEGLLRVDSREDAFREIERAFERPVVDHC